MSPRVMPAPSRWKTKKAESLFKFLLIERRPHLKEKIIEQLWPESPPHLGDTSLRTALNNARKALDLGEHGGESLILKRGMIFINPQIKIYSDYEIFTSIARYALQEADTANPKLMDLLEEAAGLYRGEFLPDDIYDDWTGSLRIQLYNLYLQVLLKQIDIYRRYGKQFSAIETCRRYLTLEPADEPVCRTAMEMLWRKGQKQQALSLYQELLAFTAREYNTGLSDETNKLYEKIKQ
jgi:LuxR family maltose regulon positive regulatory protein